MDDEDDVGFTVMGKTDAALIVKEDGSYELVLPTDDDAVTIRVMNVILKMLRNEELVEYVVDWEGDDDFDVTKAEEVWH